MRGRRLLPEQPLDPRTVRQDPNAPSDAARFVRGGDWQRLNSTGQSPPTPSLRALRGLDAGPSAPREPGTGLPPSRLELF